MRPRNTKPKTSPKEFMFPLYSTWVTYCCCNPAINFCAERPYAPGIPRLKYENKQHDCAAGTAVQKNLKKPRRGLKPQRKITKLTMNPARGTWIGKGDKLMTNVPMASKMKRIPINRQKYCPPTLASLQCQEEKDTVRYPRWQPAPAPIKAVLIISRILKEKACTWKSYERKYE